MAAMFTAAYFGRFDSIAQLPPPLNSNLRKYAPPLPYTFTRKNFFTIQNQQGVFSDVTKGDYIKDGMRLHDAKKRIYRVFYWINEIPFSNQRDDTPADFTKIALPTGCVIAIRKAYIDSKWVSKFEELRKRGGECWHEKPGSDLDLIYKVAIMNVTT